VRENDAARWMRWCKRRRIRAHNGDGCSHGKMREERKAARWLGTAPPALRRSGDPDVVTAVEAGDGAEDRGRSGRGSDLDRRTRRSRFFLRTSAGKQRKGGRSAAAAEDGRGGSISSDEAHRQRQNCFSPRQAHAARRQVSGLREHVAARVRS